MRNITQTSYVTDFWKKTRRKTSVEQCAFNETVRKERKKVFLTVDLGRRLAPNSDGVLSGIANTIPLDATAKYNATINKFGLKYNGVLRSLPIWTSEERLPHWDRWFCYTQTLDSGHSRIDLSGYSTRCLVLLTDHLWFHGLTPSPTSYTERTWHPNGSNRSEITINRIRYFELFSNSVCIAPLSFVLCKVLSRPRPTWTSKVKSPLESFLASKAFWKPSRELQSLANFVWICHAAKVNQPWIVRSAAGAVRSACMPSHFAL